MMRMTSNDNFSAALLLMKEINGKITSSTPTYQQEQKLQNYTMRIVVLVSVLAFHYQIILPQQKNRKTVIIPFSLSQCPLSSSRSCIDQNLTFALIQK